ncbi:hypothetical protein C7M84_015273 [Penaeus vannamei]|uniref:Fucosyltransferase n=1 Tax=Penaeus vannamei TaxID=6689 RepID=A0A3R7NU07_PENVA|nr:hypothetical protein C7M84_015273 [Penaeus vannamei]
MAAFLAKFLWEKQTPIGEYPVHRKVSYTSIASDPLPMTQAWNRSQKKMDIERISDFKALKPDLKLAEGPKLILFWTDWGAGVSWEQRFGTEKDLMSCPTGRCRLSNNKKDIGKAHAVLFKSDRLLRPSLIHEHKSALDAYLEDIALNTTLMEVMGIKWRAFVTRPKLLMSWIDGNCSTDSKREEYVEKLAKYVHLESYGTCGRFRCATWGHMNVGKCWKTYIATKYLFALAMEDYLCDHYVSEGLYRPLVHGLVPVVWGGTDYRHILPPGSYIDARMYHPSALGDLLTALQRNPIAYGKYHVWRRHWTLTKRGSLCELCHRLHTDTTRGHHIDIPKWRLETEQCMVAPSRMFDSEAWKEVIYQ